MFKILLDPKRAIKHPWGIFAIAIVYSSISILFSIWVFTDYASIAMIFLTVFSCLYLVQRSIKLEEEKESVFASEKWLLKEHAKIVKLLLFLFLGFTVSFTIWSFALPTQQVATMFAFQESTIQGIKATIATGNFGSPQAFLPILTNNIKVLVISLIFAFFYGAGALYVLVWNASVMGLVIGNLAKNSLGIVSLPIAFTKYFIHGIPEMIAYFTTAVAGGILYIATIKGDFTQKETRNKIIKDVSILVGISVLILILSGLIEVFISPYI